MSAGPGQAQLLLHLHLDGQAVGVPAEAAHDPVPAHRPVAGDDVLEHPGEQGAVVRAAGGEGGPVVEGELRLGGPHLAPRWRRRRSRSHRSRIGVSSSGKETSGGTLRNALCSAIGRPRSAASVAAGTGGARGTTRLAAPRGGRSWAPYRRGAGGFYSGWARSSRGSGVMSAPGAGTGLTPSAGSLGLRVRAARPRRAPWRADGSRERGRDRHRAGRPYDGDLVVAARCLRAHPDGVLVEVWVVPGSRRDPVGGDPRRGPAGAGHRPRRGREGQSGRGGAWSPAAVGGRRGRSGRRARITAQAGAGARAEVGQAAAALAGNPRRRR